MIERVLDTITKHKLIKNGDNIVIGISGGPDSVCLFHILHHISKRYKLNLFALHVNHMLRGEEARLDELYVKELCTSFGVPLKVVSKDIHQMSKKFGISIEEAGREIRYSSFGQYALEVGGAQIAVAHNKNDLVETVLMNIIRGSGLEGLKGMDYKRDNIIRPLLDIDRKDIEDYCRENMLNPRTDLSNLETIYTRNKVRLDLIPAINKNFNVNITDSVSRLALLSREDNDFIEGVAADAYKSCIIKKQESDLLLSIERLKKLHCAISKRVIRAAIKEVRGDLKGIESKHIELVMDLIQNGRTGLEIHLPGKLRVLRSYNILKVCYFKEHVGIINFEEKLNIPGFTLIKEIRATIEAKMEEKNGMSIEEFDNIGYNSLEQFFDYDKLKTGINIRNRRNGDIFKPIKSNGTKKLKEYFIDNKIPKEKRSMIPLVTIQNEVVWIIGYKISDKFKVTENTKSVLRLKYKSTD